MAIGGQSRPEVDSAGCEAIALGRDPRQFGNRAYEARRGDRSVVAHGDDPQHAATRPRARQSDALAGALYQRGAAYADVKARATTEATGASRSARTGTCAERSPRPAC